MQHSRLSLELLFSADQQRKIALKTIKCECIYFQHYFPSFFSFFSFSLFLPPPVHPPLPLSTSVLYSMNTSAFFLSVFGQKLYPTFITDTSLQFQIPTLCQIPISCCLISIHLLLFLLLLPFPAWTSSNPASSNFLRKAPY